MSEQITVAVPSVSTAGSLLIIAWRRLILVTPRASTMVTTAGNPSGTAATARLIATMNISSKFSPRHSPIINTRTTIDAAAIPSVFPSLPNLCCKGVDSGTESSSSRAIRPSSVFIPVSTTMALPRPLVMVVPMKSMFFRSPTGIWPELITAVFFSAGTDSPVSADSLECRETASTSLASAGTESPASSRIKSPGTISSAFICITCPPLNTFADGLVMSFKALRAFSALLSCSTLITAFRITIIRMTMASSHSPRNAETTTAKMRINTRISFIWLKKIDKILRGGFSCRTFGP
ncbi:MAG: hypothetical protein BWY65_01625 [Firmicutes bacterium ADurb.Bin373]|nr:MAG: hypothetical protein BWY65_01625 [Firmicutes bacterium ADurb.Bin373]